MKFFPFDIPCSISAVLFRMFLTSNYFSIFEMASSQNLSGFNQRMNGIIRIR